MRREGSGASWDCSNGDPSTTSRLDTQTGNQDSGKLEEDAYTDNASTSSMVFPELEGRYKVLRKIGEGKGKLRVGE